MKITNHSGHQLFYSALNYRMLRAFIFAHILAFCLRNCVVRKLQSKLFHWLLQVEMRCPSNISCIRTRASKRSQVRIYCRCNNQAGRTSASNDVVQSQRSLVPLHPRQVPCIPFPGSLAFWWRVFDCVQRYTFCHASSLQCIVDLLLFFLPSGVVIWVLYNGALQALPSWHVNDFSSFTLKSGAVASVECTVAHHSRSSWSFKKVVSVFDPASSAIALVQLLWGKQFSRNFMAAEFHHRPITNLGQAKNCLQWLA